MLEVNGRVSMYQRVRDGLVESAGMVGGRVLLGYVTGPWCVN